MLEKRARFGLYLMEMNASELFTLPASLAVFKDFFKPEMAPWEWVGQIKAALAAVNWRQARRPQGAPTGVSIKGDVFLAEGVKLPPFASIEGPAWIGAGTEIRPGAYIRGNVIAGEGCVLGNSCEYKNCLLMDKVETPHFNYVGDSVLGTQAHLGAGVICANLKLERDEVWVQTSDKKRVSTGMRKLGAMLGEGAQAGCNAVLQPGSILGKRAVVLSTVAFSGFLPEGKMAWNGTRIATLRRL